MLKEVANRNYLALTVYSINGISVVFKSPVKQILWDKNVKDLYIIILFFFDFRETGKEGERKRNLDVREKHQLAAFHRYPSWGLNLQQACVLIRNPTGNLLVCRTMPNRARAKIFKLKEFPPRTMP